MNYLFVNSLIFGGVDVASSQRFYHRFPEKRIHQPGGAQFGVKSRQNVERRHCLGKLSLVVVKPAVFGLEFCTNIDDNVALGQNF